MTPSPKSNQPDEPSIQRLINTLNLLFFAFLAGMVGFALVVIYLVQSGNMETTSELDEVFVYLVPFMGLAGFVGSRFLYNQILSQTQNMNATNKLVKYQTATLIRFALLEAPSLFATVAYLLTGNKNHLVTLGILLLLFLMNKPSVEKCREELSSY